jgi:predicted solute-binding protein
MPRLDLGISWQELNGCHQVFALMLPAKSTLGDTKIKSWYDGLFKP